MCKCSITSTPHPSSGTDSAGNDQAASSTSSSFAASPIPGSPVLIGEEGPIEGSNVVSMVSLRAGREDEGDNSTTVSQESDVSSTQSHAPLLGHHTGSDEPNIETMPYSPQVEVNIESLVPTSGTET